MMTHTSDNLATHIENFREQQTSLKTDMLVTMGVRAGNMDAMNVISLPGTVTGETEIAKFCENAVDLYISTDFEMCFDEYIESKLIEKYGVNDSEQPG